MLNAAWVIASGLGMIALLLGVLTAILYLLCWVVLITVRLFPMIGKRHRHAQWENLNHGGKVAAGAASSSSTRASNVETR